MEIRYFERLLDEIERETQQAQAAMRAAQCHVRHVRDVALVILASLAVLCTLLLEGETVTPLLLARRFTLDPLLLIDVLTLGHPLGAEPCKRAG